MGRFDLASTLNIDCHIGLCFYRVVQKRGHPRNSMGVRFFGPPCMVTPIALAQYGTVCREGYTGLQNYRTKYHRGTDGQECNGSGM